MITAAGVQVSFYYVGTDPKKCCRERKPDLEHLELLCENYLGLAHATLLLLLLLRRPDSSSIERAKKTPDDRRDARSLQLPLELVRGRTAAVQLCLEDKVRRSF